MLAGLVALPWCLWAAWRYKRADALAFALLYLASIGLWVDSGKPIQFYYHYLLPGTFLMACLALALDAIWRKAATGARRAAADRNCGRAICLVLPILSAAELHNGAKSYEDWMWLDSWR